MPHAHQTPNPIADTAAEPDDPWAPVRADYLNGDPAPILAERYGVSERSIRRHAATQGWRRRDLSRLRPPSTDETAERIPAFEPIAAVNADDMAELLLHPDPTYLRFFAFKRATEQAAFDRPTGCLAWMRVVQILDRTSERGFCADRDFSPADRIRALFVAGLEAEEARRLGMDDRDDG